MAAVPGRSASDLWCRKLVHVRPPPGPRGRERDTFLRGVATIASETGSPRPPLLLLDLQRLLAAERLASYRRRPGAGEAGSRPPQGQGA